MNRFSVSCCCTLMIGTSALAAQRLVAPNAKADGNEAQTTGFEPDGTEVELPRSAGIWADFDGDGLPDLYLPGVTGESRLWRNCGSGRFEDVTVATGLDQVAAHSLARSGDFDRDGLPDLLVASSSSSPRLLRGTRGGLFEDVTDTSGLLNVPVATDAAFLDYDRDGWLDLWLLGSKVLLLRNENGRFKQVLEFDRAPPALGSRFPVDKDDGSSSRAGDMKSDTSRREGPIRHVHRDVITRAGSTDPLRALPFGSTAPGSHEVLTGSVAEALIDQSGNSPSVRASSVPTLGMLYPVSEDLFVSPTGPVVGIGTVDPQTNLHVSDDFDCVIRSHSTTPYGQGVAGFQLEKDGIGWTIATGGADFGGTGGIGFRTFDQVTRFLVDSVGRFAIGTINPATSLHVADDLCVVRAQSTSVHGQGLAGFQVAKDGGGWTIGTGADDYGGVGAIGFRNFTDLTAMVMKEDGRMGVGTTDPTARLHVAGDFRVDGLATIAQKLTASTLSDAGVLLQDGPSSVNVVASSIVGHPNNGGIGVFDSATSMRAGVQVNNQGIGIVFGDVKQFVTENPNDPETKIWYACVEGPEAAAYVRGTARLVAGEATIALPPHFLSVAVAEGMTVQLTPLSADSKGLAVVQKSLDGVVVREMHQGKGTYQFDWEIKAIRKGFEDYEVVRPREYGELERPLTQE